MRARIQLRITKKAGGATLPVSRASSFVIASLLLLTESDLLGPARDNLSAQQSTATTTSMGTRRPDRNSIVSASSDPSCSACLCLSIIPDGVSAIAWARFGRGRPGLPRHRSSDRAVMRTRRRRALDHIIADGRNYHHRETCAPVDGAAAGRYDRRGRRSPCERNQQPPQQINC